MRRYPWIAPVVLLGLAVRLFRLGAWDIGLDEAYSAHVAALPLGDLLGFVARDDFHPPLYYVFLHGWRMVAGADEFWLRFPSVVFGTLSIGVVHRLGTEVADERVGLAAALLLALSPLHVFHAQDLRMYALLVLVGSTALLFFVQGVQRDRSGDWLAHALFLALALYTHYGAFLLLAGEAVAVVALVRSFPLRRWLLSVSAALLAFAPWAVVFAQHASRTVPSEAAGLLLPLQQVAYALVAFTSDFLPPGTPLLKAGILVVFGSAAVYGVLRLGDRRAWILVATSLGALAVAALVGMRFRAIAVGTNVLIPRTLLLASAGYLVLLAAAVTRARPQAVGWGLLAALVALNLSALPRVYYGPRPLWGPWRAVARYVAERVHRGDGIVVVSGFWARPLDFYFHPPDGVPVVRYGGRHDLPHVVGVVRQSRRVWLLLKQPEAVDPYGRVRGLLWSREDLVAQAAFPTGIRIEVYGPRGGP
jgi:uncharacterized membrane protein